MSARLLPFSLMAFVALTSGCSSVGWRHHCRPLMSTPLLSRPIATPYASPYTGMPAPAPIVAPGYAPGGYMSGGYAPGYGSADGLPAYSGIPTASNCSSCSQSPGGTLLGSNVSVQPQPIQGPLGYGQTMYPSGGQPSVYPQLIPPGSEKLGPPTILPPSGAGPKVEIVPQPMPLKKN